MALHPPIALAEGQLRPAHATPAAAAAAAASAANRTDDLTRGTTASGHRTPIERALNPTPQAAQVRHDPTGRYLHPGARAHEGTAPAGGTPWPRTATASSAPSASAASACHPRTLPQGVATTTRGR